MGPSVEVVVHDPGWCVSERELRATLADVPLRGARVEVRVTAEGALRRVDLRVVQRETQWQRSFGPIPIDACPSMPEVIAASVRRYLVDVGSTGFAVVDVLVPVTASLSVLDWDRGTSVGAVGLPRFGAGARFEVGLTRADLVVGLQTEVGPRFALGAGDARLGESVVSAGVGLHGPGEWRLTAGGAGGVAVARGSGFLDDRLGAGPVAFGWVGLGNRVVPGFDVSLGLRVHAVRPRVVAAYGDGDTWAAMMEEPWVRAEVTLAPVVKSLKVRRAAGHEGVK